MENIVRTSAFRFRAGDYNDFFDVEDRIRFHKKYERYMNPILETASRKIGNTKLETEPVVLMENPGMIGSKGWLKVATSASPMSSKFMDDRTGWFVDINLGHYTDYNIGSLQILHMGYLIHLMNEVAEYFEIEPKEIFVVNSFRDVSQREQVRINNFDVRPIPEHMLARQE